MSRPPLQRSGLRISPELHPETINAAHSKIHLAPATPLLARPPRMVRRCRLRTISSFSTHTIQLLPGAFAGGVLRGATQPPLFTPEPLLLKLFSCRCHPPAIQSDSTLAQLSHTNGGGEHGDQSGQTSRVSRQGHRRFRRCIQRRLN